MKKQFIIIISLFLYLFSYSQKSLDSDLLYADQSPMEIKLNYSNKNMKKNTTDSTFIKTDLNYYYKEKWNTIPVSLRARGNFRRAKCYFPPIKMKIKKGQYKNTIFDGNKSLKLVLPCRIEDEKNDNILKEYIAYKIYELISPYHFKTRRVNIEFTEPKGKKVKTFSLKGFLIEDDSKLEKRFGGKVVEQFVHPLAMQDLSSVQHAFFQYLIGNTDFSIAYQHNGKVLYDSKTFIPLPYDFDMTGWVDPSYGFGNPTLKLSSLTERRFRGFKRDNELMNNVRKQFVDSKDEITSLLDSFKSQFDNEDEFENMYSFMLEFYKIIEDDSKFDKLILKQARTK
ncbi:MAG: hypothetical protein HN595_04095 [Flavobacteriaceae bacterium]|nr:hypothetical protein [Flavobacteriaceae bacterium]